MTGGGMNIIIPMAGQGSRFAKCGYKPPKPLICIAGVPMIVQLLLDIKFLPKDTLYVGIQRAAEQEHHILKKLQANLLNFETTVVPVYLDGQTRGAAETLQIIIENMRHDHRHRRTISLDCDTLYFYDILEELRKVPEKFGSICYFEDEKDEPVFSYIRISEESGKVLDIQEKNRISSFANTGAYGFENAIELSNYLRRLLSKPLPKIGEFHTSSVIAEMMKDGVTFQAIEVPASNFACVGTPKQLERFLESPMRTKCIREGHKIVFNLDTVSHFPGNIPSTEDILLASLSSEFLQFIRKMKEDGLNVELSLSGDFMSFLKREAFEKASGNLEFMYSDRVSRKIASVQGTLFPVDTNFRQSVGW